MINYIIDCSLVDDQCEKGFETIPFLQFLVNAFMIGVTIIVVAVPEVYNYSLRINKGTSSGRYNYSSFFSQ